MAGPGWETEPDPRSAPTTPQFALLLKILGCAGLIAAPFIPLWGPYGEDFTVFYPPTSHWLPITVVAGIKSSPNPANSPTT